MMKTKPTHSEIQHKTQVILGPPLDYSFKNIRTLQQLLNNNSKQTPSNPTEQLMKTQTPGPQNSEKQIGDTATETHLNIVRTIEVEQSKGNLVKQLINKKIQKSASKIVHKSQVHTTSLFLKYNKLTSIQGFTEIVQQLLPAPQWQQLMWVDLSHNRLSNISKELQSLPQLKNLYLHVNFISSFKEFQNLQKAPLLRTFTIHGNPIENYPEFRSLLTCILPQLQKIDSALLTKREKERGQVLKKQGAKYPIINNPEKPPVDSEEEENN